MKKELQYFKIEQAENHKNRIYSIGMKMKPYLRPRWSGIDTLDIYMEGYGQFWQTRAAETSKWSPCPEKNLWR